MKASRICCAALFALAFAQPASADWTYVNLSNITKFYIDRDTVRQSGGKTVFWWKSVYAVPEKDGVKETISIEELDCGIMRSQTLQYTMYDAKGDVVYSSTSAIPSSYVIPSSAFYRVAKTACALAQ